MDPSFLQALALRTAVDDDADELIPLFVDETARLSEDLRTAEERGDDLKIMRCMHKLRGSAAIYGFKSLSTFAALAESSPKDFASDRLSAVVDQVRQLIQQRYV